MQPGVPGGGIVRARRPTPRSCIVSALLPAEALAPVGGAVGANRTVPVRGAGRGGRARPRAGPFRGGRVALARYSFRPSEGGGAQGRRDAAPRVPARTRQVGPVSRPRKSLRGVLCEEEQTPSEGIPGVPLPSPLGGSRNRRSSRPLAPEAPGSRI